MVPVFGQITLTQPGSVGRGLCGRMKKENKIVYAIQDAAINIKSQGALTEQIAHQSLNLDGLYLPHHNGILFSSNRTGSYEIWFKNDKHQKKLTDIKASYIHTIIVDEQNKNVAFTYSKDGQKHTSHLSLETNQVLSTIVIDKNSYLLSWGDNSNVFLNQQSDQNYNLINLDFAKEQQTVMAYNAGITAKSTSKGLYYYCFEKQALVFQSNSGNVEPIVDLKNSALQSRAKSIKLTEKGAFYLSRVDGKQIINFYDYNAKTTQPLFMLDRRQFVTDLGFINNAPYVIFDESDKISSQIVELLISQ